MIRLLNVRHFLHRYGSVRSSRSSNTLLLQQLVPAVSSLDTTAVATSTLVQQQQQQQTFCAAAAASQTGAQKRAIQQNQISPSTKTTGTSTTTTTTTTTPTNTNNNDNTPFIAAAAIAAIAGGGAYYYYSKNKDVDTTVEIVKEEEKVSVSPIAVDDTVKDENEPVVVVPPATTSSTSTTTPIANRVTAITVPSKMKNTAPTTTAAAAAASSSIDHPPHGNRVSTVLHSPTTTTTSSSSVPVEEGEKENVSSSSSSSSINDTKTTQDAIQELQSTNTTAGMESLIASHQSMWNSTSAATSANGSSSTIEQLQIRIGQLQNELQDRTKWEAIRLKEFLIMKEKDVSNQYLELLQKQRIEFEDLMAKKLREQEHVLAQQYYHSIQEKEATIQNVLQTALDAQKQEMEDDKKAWEEMTIMNIQGKVEEQFMQKLEEYKIQMAKSLQEKVQQMSILSDKIQQLQTALETSQNSKEGSLKAHRISAAALALTEKLETHDSAKMELETLKLAAGNEGVIATACNTIPPSVSVTGVPTLSELQTKFLSSVAPKCRQAAFVPKGRVGLEGQLAGMLFSTIRYAPSYDDVAPESDAVDKNDDADHILVRTKQYVQLGELELAINELDKLSGQPAFIAADWKKDAIDRVNVEKALKVIKMECALLNESCLQK